MWYCMNIHFNSSRLQDHSQFHKLLTYFQGHCKLQILSTNFNSLHPSWAGRGMAKGELKKVTHTLHTHGHISGFQHSVPLPVLSGKMLLVWPRTSGSMTIASKRMVRSYSSFFLITISQLSLSKHNRPSVIWQKSILVSLLSLSVWIV